MNWSKSSKVDKSVPKLKKEKTTQSRLILIYLIFKSIPGIVIVLILLWLPHFHLVLQRSVCTRPSVYTVGILLLMLIGFSLILLYDYTRQLVFAFLAQYIYYCGFWTKRAIVCSSFSSKILLYLLDTWKLTSIPKKFELYLPFVHLHWPK